ncbi:4'-phosphopantetheinyl transferase family protein [Methylobacterium komagatae]|uniref:4'-phosphopantetheinyl transferase family protein n=1 Tax=Methylobacterium komagatae TaxID=374425 RepID=A0ABW2BKZ9_9HYPH
MSSQVVIVALDLDPQRLSRCAALLDKEETQRAGRFLRQADRERFIASHAALRVVLSHVLDLQPGEFRFGCEETGRPNLIAPSGSGLDFNLSHSGEIALVGFTREGRIGVDVEIRRPLPDALRIARGHFAPEEVRALEDLPVSEREAAFFGLWTRKEAVVKALGAGLSQPLSRFSVTVPPEPPALLKMASGTRSWTLTSLDLGPDAFATVAITAPGLAIAHHTLTAGWADGFDAK